ncbi:NADP-dependent oxidoreductase domain-containing protein [Pterulicium gracile]|uniref:NADP-dependent oxidoreductase domain-containing protein n=1 Tax=Pterulicium gracile TaxID=1884261 RepID=A0A5C3Q917_9AGAR|nr:NADP-dependent oxidoreductase domain-containing protein [Pterula gracilis]
MSSAKASTFYPTSQLGKNGPIVSATGFGVMGIGGVFYGPVLGLVRYVTSLISSKIAHYLTIIPADFYMNSEKSIGTWLAQTNGRSEIFLATKFGASNLEDEQSHYSAPIFRPTISTCIKHHRVDPNVPIEVVLETLRPAVEKGTIKYLGLSECSVETPRRARAVRGVGEKVIAAQMQFSPFEITIETNGFVAAAKELGVAIVPYSPLGRGLISGRYRSRADLPRDDFRLNIPRFSEENFPKNVELVDKFQEIASKYRATPAQIPLAWILAEHNDFFPIPGSQTIARLQENANGALVNLSAEDVKVIRKMAEVPGNPAAPSVPAVGQTSRTYQDGAYTPWTPAATASPTSPVLAVTSATIAALSTAEPTTSLAASPTTSSTTAPSINAAQVELSSTAEAVLPTFSQPPSQDPFENTSDSLSPSTSPATSMDQSTNDRSVSPGVIAGIVIGSLALIGLVGFLVFVWLRRRRENRQSKDKRNSSYAMYGDKSALIGGGSGGDFERVPNRDVDHDAGPSSPHPWSPTSPPAAMNPGFEPQQRNYMQQAPVNAEPQQSHYARKSTRLPPVLPLNIIKPVSPRESRTDLPYADPNGRAPHLNFVDPPPRPQRGKTSSTARSMSSAYSQASASDRANSYYEFHPPPPRRGGGNNHFHPTLNTINSYGSSSSPAPSTHRSMSPNILHTRFSVSKSALFDPQDEDDNGSRTPIAMSPTSSPYFPPGMANSSTGQTSSNGGKPPSFGQPTSTGNISISDFPAVPPRSQVEASTPQRNVGMQPKKSMAASIVSASPVSGVPSSSSSFLPNPVAPEDTFESLFSNDPRGYGFDPRNDPRTYSSYVSESSAAANAARVRAQAQVLWSPGVSSPSEKEKGLQREDTTVVKGLLRSRLGADGAGGGKRSSWQDPMRAGTGVSMIERDGSL